VKRSSSGTKSYWMLKVVKQIRRSQQLSLAALNDCGIQRLPAVCASGMGSETTLT